MADYAPIYMDLYDSDDFETLIDLTIDENETPEGDAPGSVIGSIGGTSPRGVLSLPYETSGNFALSGLNLVVGPNGGTMAPGNYDVVVVENNPYAANSPRGTTITITVTPSGG